MVEDESQWAALDRGRNTSFRGPHPSWYFAEGWEKRFHLLCIECGRKEYGVPCPSSLYRVYLPPLTKTC